MIDDHVFTFYKIWTLRSLWKTIKRWLSKPTHQFPPSFSMNSTIDSPCVCVNRAQGFFNLTHFRPFYFRKMSFFWQSLWSWKDGEWLFVYVKLTTLCKLLMLYLMKYYEYKKENICIIVWIRAKLERIAQTSRIQISWLRKLFIQIYILHVVFESLFDPVLVHIKFHYNNF